MSTNKTRSFPFASSLPSPSISLDVW